MWAERWGLGHRRLVRWNWELTVKGLRVRTGDRHQVCEMRDGKVGIGPVDLLVDPLDGQGGRFVVVVVSCVGRDTTATEAVSQPVPLELEVRSYFYSSRTRTLPLL